MKNFLICGFKSSFNSIEGFKEVLCLGDKANIETIKEYYNRQYPFNVKIEILNIKCLEENKLKLNLN